jgi:hypothetical protein
MIRTQIYLTEKERAGLTALSNFSRKKQSELIREAIDRLLKESDPINRQKVIEAAAGMWRGRKDLPDFDRLRSEWDRD